MKLDLGFSLKKQISYTLDCSVQPFVQVVKNSPSFHDPISFIALMETIIHWTSPCTGTLASVPPHILSSRPFYPLMYVCKLYFSTSL